MKTKITRITGVFLSVVMLVVMLSAFALNVEAADGDPCSSSNCSGTYENGFCSECQNYEKPDISEDGYCLIDNAGKLYYWCVFQDNTQSPVYFKNARLTSNIVLNRNVIVDGKLNTDAEAVAKFRLWKPETITCGAVFDGQGYTISGLYTDASLSKSAVGLFSGISTGVTVKNLSVLDSYFASVEYSTLAGAIAGENNGTISNCFSNAVIDVDAYDESSFASASVGGIVGRNSGTVENSYFTGTAEASAVSEGTDSSDTARVSIGGIVGENRGDVLNSYSVGSVKSNGVTATDPLREKENVGDAIGLSEEGSTVTNCYYLASNETDSLEGTTFVTEEKLASGEIAYLLNNGVTDGTQAFYQTVGNGIPTFKGDTVYMHTHCRGTGKVYSNSASPKHQSEVVGEEYFDANGVCKICGEQAAVKVYALSMSVGSTNLFKTEYYSNIIEAFASQTVKASIHYPVKVTLLKDVKIESYIDASSGMVDFDTQSYTIENEHIFGNVLRLNGADVTLKGSGTLKGKVSAVTVGNGSTLVLSDNVNLISDNYAVEVNSGSFTMNGGSIEADDAIKYMSFDEINITDGRIVGRLVNSQIGTEDYPVITGGSFPNGIILSSSSNTTIDKLIGNGYYVCDEAGTILDAKVKSIDGAVEVKDLIGIINRISESAKNVEDGKTPIFKVESGDLKVSYDSGATWASVGANLTGDKGDKGDKGDQGDKGDKGDVGAIGASGKDGINGKDGLDGKNAEIGLTVAAIVIGSIALVINIALIAYIFSKKKNAF